MDRRAFRCRRSSATARQEQRDLMGTRLFELTYDAPRRLEMMHGDAHPGNFMLLPDGKMGVIDFGAVAPLPGGLTRSSWATCCAMRSTRITTT